jgi:CelD/BcsL family acetyltransferase involved in cellulose biosynthesis
MRHELRMIHGIRAFQALRAGWEALEGTAADPSPFLTYQYCELAAAFVFAQGGSIAVALVHGEDHDLLALWPLAIRREGVLRIARAPTCGNDQEYGGPLVKGAASRAVVGEALRCALRAPADVLEIFMVEEGSLLARVLAEAPQSWLLPLLPKRLRTIAGYTIRLGGFRRWEDFAARFSQPFRANLRRCVRRLNEKGQAELGWCRTQGDAEAVLRWLFANKRRALNARGMKTDLAKDRQVETFFVALARRTDLPATPLVAFVKLDGVPVAASVNLVGQRAVQGLITTYDDAFGRYSVGIMLTDFMVRWAHAKGLDFDLRPYHADYKAQWATHVTSHWTRTVFLSPRGRLREFSLLGLQVSRVLRRLMKRANGRARTERGARGSP